jgi:predicted GIY-YIG superfamily endonuclease
MEAIVNNFISKLDNIISIIKFQINYIDNFCYIPINNDINILVKVSGSTIDHIEMVYTEDRKKEIGAIETTIKNLTGVKVENSYTDMVVKKSNNYKWTKEKCKEEAKKYKSRSEFGKNSSGAYNAALKNNWIDEFFPVLLGNKYRRMVYVFLFNDKCVYVGLTWNITERKRNHLKDKTSSVYKHIKNTCSKYELIELTDYIDKDEASILEEEYINYYKNNGYIILNRMKGGGLGGFRNEYTYDECEAAAKKFGCKSKFTNSKYYLVAKRNNWLNNLSLHFNRPVVWNKKWTKEICLEIAKQFSSREDFREKRPDAYNAALKNNWIDVVCDGLKFFRHKKGYWTYENVKKEASYYKNIMEFKNNSSSAYNVAYNNNWLKDIGSHFNYKIKSKEYLTYDICKELASQYKNRSHFHDKSQTAYIYSRKNNWLDDFFPM